MGMPVLSRVEWTAYLEVSTVNSAELLGRRGRDPRNHALAEFPSRWQMQRANRGVNQSWVPKSPPPIFPILLTLIQEYGVRRRFVCSRLVWRPNHARCWKPIPEYSAKAK